MKKLVILTLCFAVLLSMLTGCGAKSSDGGGFGNVAVISSTEPSVPADDTDVLTAGIFNRINSGIYHMHMIITSEDDVTEVHSYAKDGEAVLKMEVMGLPVRMIYKDGKTYTVIDDLKMVSVSESDLNEDMPVMANTSNLTYVGEDSGEFMGNTYKYDEYTNAEDSRLLYFMDTGDLKGIRVINTESKITDVEIIAFNKEVPDDVFNIPEDYEFYDEISDDTGVNSIENEIYELGPDTVPSIRAIVGERLCPERGTSLVNGVTVMEARYETDPDDPTQAANDISEYFQYLIENEGFISLVTFDGLPYEGGVDVSLAKNSTDEGEIIILYITYDYFGYTLEFHKGEGTLTPLDTEDTEPTESITESQKSAPAEPPKPTNPPATQAPKATEPPKPTAPPPTQAPKATEPPKPTAPPATQAPKPTEPPKPTDPPPTQAPKATEPPKPTAPPETQAPKPTEPPKPTDPPVPVSNNALTADVLKTMKGGTYHMKCRGFVEDFGTVEYEIYTKNGIMAMMVESDGMTVRIVVGNGKTYSIIDDLEMMMVDDADSNDYADFIGDTDDLIYVSTDSGNFSGKTYKYDEYKDKNGDRYFFYMDGSSLKGIRTISGGITEDMEILVFDINVPDAVFNIPTDYEIY